MGSANDNNETVSDTFKRKNPSQIKIGQDNLSLGNTMSDNHRNLSVK